MCVFRVVRPSERCPFRCFLAVSRSWKGGGGGGAGLSAASQVRRRLNCRSPRCAVQLLRMLKGGRGLPRSSHLLFPSCVFVWFGLSCSSGESEKAYWLLTLAVSPGAVPALLRYAEGGRGMCVLVVVVVVRCFFFPVLVGTVQMLSKNCFDSSTLFPLIKLLLSYIFPVLSVGGDSSPPTGHLIDAMVWWRAVLRGEQNTCVLCSFCSSHAFFFPEKKKKKKRSRSPISSRGLVGDYTLVVIETSPLVCRYGNCNYRRPGMIGRPKFQFVWSFRTHTPRSRD